MGDLSPIGVVDCIEADATAARGGEVLRVPEIAASCVAAVPVGGSAALASGGAGDDAAGFADGSDVVLEDRRHRLNNPNMKFPANDLRREALTSRLTNKKC
jgi:hypothetical protein